MNLLIALHRTVPRHLHNVPVLVTALKALPDWFITSKTGTFYI
jgi:hypothetical protein